MKRLLIVFCLLFVAKAFAQQPVNANTTVTLEQLSTVNDLSGYTGNANSLMVTNNRTGGIFYYTKEKHTIDNGIVFQGKDKGYWVRMYDQSGAVDIAWFGAKMDSTTDDAEALKKALLYPVVKITGNIALNGKTKIPQGKTLEFTDGGKITVTDTFALKIDAFVKANDYQSLFRGTGKIVFGSNSVPHVSACWFGAVADCRGFKTGEGTDNTQPIQMAIEAAQKVSEVFLPPTAANQSYRITSTISIRKKLHFFTFRFHGGGTTITYNADDRATVIFADFHDGPAINVQGSRRVYLSDFSLKGINLLPKRLAAYDTINTRVSINRPTSFLSPGVTLNYTAITTDAEKDSKVWSADVVFERLQIENFCLGIGISQAGNMQGDRMRVENCQINQCVYGISVGQAQNRACHFFNVDMNRVWCGITNTTYGDHTGSVFQLTGGQWCNVYKCFIIQPSYLGQCVISGLYTEAIGAIGDIGNNTPNNSSILFSGCYFFMQDGGLNHGYAFTPPFYTLWAYANVTFEACNFWSGRHYIAMFAGAAPGHYNGSSITMHGCSIHHCSTMHIKGNSFIENSYMIPFPGLINYNRNITLDLQGNNRYNTGYTTISAVSGMENITDNDASFTNSGNIVRKIPRFYVVQEAQNHINNVHYARDTISFTYDAYLDSTFFKYVLPGDAIGTTLINTPVTEYDNPTLQVFTIDRSSRTVTAWAHTATISFEKMGLYTNSFITTQPITAFVEKGKASISHISHPDKLQDGDFFSFNGAAKAYRILNINKADSSATLFDVIKEVTSGKMTIYNEILTDNSIQTSSTTALRTVEESTTMTPNDYTVIASSTNADITITLPVDLATGKIFNIKRVGTHLVRILSKSTSIDGKSEYQLKDDYQNVQLQYDGTQFMILSK